MARNGIPNPFNPMDPDWQRKAKPKQKRKPTGSKQYIKGGKLTRRPKNYK